MSKREVWGTPLAILLASLAPNGGCSCGDVARPGGDADTDGNTDDGGNGDGADADADDGSTGEPPPSVSECRLPTLAIYEGLHPSCVGCHDEGTNLPLMADFVSFERLVAYDSAMVVPGRPEDSALVAMLEGNAPPPMDQMPPGAVSFAEMAQMGQTDVSLEDIEAWIADLQPCEVPDGDHSPRYARRVGAEHIVRSLRAQLHVTMEQTEHVSRFPVDDPVFGVMTRGNNSSGQAWARWAALGGPDYLKGNVRNDVWSPLFIQTIGPLGQAWCGRSIELGHDALFPAATASATDEASVRANIEALYLDMLGIVATDADIDAMYEDVYLTYASNESHEIGMKAVCSAFVRHPLWLTY